MKAISLLFSLLLQLICLNINYAQCTGKPETFISGGYRHTLLLKNRKLYTSGENYAGQLGHSKVGAGQKVNKYDRASASSKVKKVKMIDAGSGAHNLALGCDGYLYAWGKNNCGQLGDGKPTECKATDAVYELSAVKVVAGETKIDFPESEFLTNIETIIAGDKSSYALLKSKKVVAWGSNSFGQLGDGGSTASSSPKYVLESSGKPLTNIKSISAGDGNLLLLSESGVVYNVGRNFDRATTHDFFAYAMEGLPVIKAIAAGDFFGLALTDGGEVYAWGENKKGQLGQEGETTNPYPKKVRSSSGDNTLSNIIAIAAGNSHALALTKDGEVLSWGSNEAGGGFGGQLGIGPLGNSNKSYKSLPVSVLMKDGQETLKKVKKISIGDNVSFAFDDEKAFGWGFNETGQLGLGHNNPVNYASILPLEVQSNPEAGDDTVSCDDVVELNGGGIEQTERRFLEWSTSGNGRFTISPENPGKGTYTRGDADGTEVTLTLTLKKPGNDKKDYLNVKFPPKLNAGPDQRVCADANQVTLAGTRSPDSYVVSWTSSSSPSTPFAGNILKPTYQLSAADKQNQSVSLIISTPYSGNAACPTITDTVKINIDAAPTALANGGANFDNCGLETDLKGVVTNGTPSWSILDTKIGTEDANIKYTLDSYPTDPVTFTLTSSPPSGNVCPAATSSIKVTYAAQPTIELVAPASVCGNKVSLTERNNLAGTWSTTPANVGRFSPENGGGPSTEFTLTTPSNLSTIDFIYEVAASEGCSINKDTATVKFVPKPTIISNVERTVCSAKDTVHLMATATPTNANIIWSKPPAQKGSFIDSLGASAIFKFAQAADNSLAAVTINVLAEDKDLPSCNTTISPSPTITFTAAPIIEVAPQTVCSTTPPIQLNAIVTNNPTGAGKWISTTGGTFTSANNISPAENDPKATYTLSATEKGLREITLKFEIPASTSCTAQSKDMVLTITPPPVVKAGNDTTVCRSDVKLKGSVSTGTGTWTSTVAGSFLPSTTDPQATFKPTTVPSGKVKLAFSVETSGACGTVSDTVEVAFATPPVVKAGNDTAVCGNKVTLKGKITGATTGTWSIINGSGTFSSPNGPGSTFESANSTGSARLVLKADAASCSTTDTVVVTFNPQPVITVKDTTICGLQSAITLKAKVSPANTPVEWFKGPTPLASLPNDPYSINYSFTEQEINGGSTILGIKTKNNSCNDTAFVKITLDTKPEVEAGPEISYCNSVASIPLNAQASSTPIWSSARGGTFGNINDKKTTYKPSESDKALGRANLTIKIPATATCPEVTDNLVIPLSQAPVVDAGSDEPVCRNKPEVPLKPIVTGADRNTWSANARGSFLPNETSLNAVFRALDLSQDTIVLTLTSLSSNNCFTQDKLNIILTPTPVVTAGPEQTICSNNPDVLLNGRVENAGGGTWSTNGDGKFMSTTGDIIYGNTTTVLNAKYKAGPRDLETTTTLKTFRLTLESREHGNCDMVSSSLTVNVTPAPTVNAGADMEECKSVASVTVRGSITGTVTTGSWSTSGSGTFDQTNSLTKTYTPSAADKDAGSVFLILTSDEGAGCRQVADTLILTFKNTPIVAAGRDETVCSNNALVNLSGSISGNTPGQWSRNGGDGTFSNGDNTNLKAEYSPGTKDKAAKRVALTLTSKSANGCNASDTMIIIINDAPSISIASNITVCANNPVAPLRAILSKPAAVQWTTTTGDGIFSAPGDANTNYTAGPQDIKAGQVALTISTLAEGGCSAVSKNVTLTISPGPEVSAGTNSSVCSNSTTIKLNGSVTKGSTKGVWTTRVEGGTFSPSANALTNSYRLPEGFNAPSIEFILTSTDNGSCGAEDDTVTFTFSNTIGVDAGKDQKVCSDHTSIQLSGTISGGDPKGSWSGGQGTFDPPSRDILNATYTPSEEEIQAGSLQLILSSISTNECTASSDTVTLSFIKQPVALAGIDKIVCANNTTLALDGSVANATGGIWETASTGGEFLPNSSDLKATYKFTPDATTGPLTFILTTTGNGDCDPATDTVEYTFSLPPIVNPGEDKIACKTDTAISLEGAVNDNSKVKWDTKGSGSFRSDDNLVTTYLPSADDKANGVTLMLSTVADGNCLPVSEVLALTFVDGPSVKAGADQSICSGITTVDLVGEGSNTSSTTWSSGSQPSFAATLGATYRLTSDEQKQTSLSFYLEGVDGNGCTARDTLEVKITNGPTISAGSDVSMCSNRSEVALNSTVPAGLSLSWQAPANGTFAPNRTEADPIYKPTEAEKSLGKATLILSATAGDGCTSIDSVDVTFTDSPTATVGEDVSICANTASVPVSGTFTVAQGVLWSNSSGDGTFTKPDDAITEYIPGPNDKKTGKITLTMTTVENGNCDAASDNLEVTINAAPVLIAPKDISLCKNTTEIALSGTVEGVSKTLWRTNGDGEFIPSASDLNAIYKVAATDIDDTLNFYLSSEDNNLCDPRDDVYTVWFTNSAGVEAGENQTVCKNNNNVQLSGKVTGDNASATWTSLGTGEFVRQTEQSLNAQYIPSKSDLDAGSVQLLLNAAASGDCAASSDTVLVTFTPAPVIILEEALTACSSLEGVPLTATIENAGGGLWSSSGSGSFTNDRSVTTSYLPTQEDLDGGDLILTLSSTENSNCASAIADVTVSFTATPTFTAGEDITRCSDNTSISLQGTSSIASANFVWTSEGTGSFTNTTALSTNYMLSDADIAAGSVNLILGPSATGGCSGVADTIAVNFRLAPAVKLGQDINVCPTTTGVVLEGEIKNAESGIWSSSGSGTFTQPESATTTYRPSGDDIALGKVTVTLTSQNNGLCDADTEDMTISFSASPTLNAGEDASVCDNNGSVNLKGTLSSPADVIWSTNGTGEFLPNNTSLEAIYKLSATDLAMKDIIVKLATRPVEGCENVSDSLKISVSNMEGRSPSVITKSVTKRRGNEFSNYINFQVLFQESMQPGLKIQRRSLLPSESGFVDIGTATLADKTFIDSNLPDPDGSYEYVVYGKNSCGDDIKSVPHHTIMLTSAVTEIDTAFILGWNHYRNWPQGVASYEVYINQGDEGSKLYATVDGGVTQVFYAGPRVKNPPCFVVKAIEKGTNPNESWSNINCIEFPKERPEIPKGISPNNDGKNDVWDIKYIEKYDNEVTIFNQWDNKVYYKRGYTNDFSGENLPDGQYYYIIKYDQKQESGPLLIVR